VTAPGRVRVVLVSDLHMATPARGRADPFAEDEAFADLLVELGGDSSTRLVLLGDTFDLVLAGDPRDPRAALDAVARAHPRVLSALADFAASGHAVELVPGNHDIALLDPVVQAHVRSLVGAELTFSPWVVHVPGVLYAEHGQQHHDINHFRSVLGNRRPSSPPALVLDEGRAAGRAEGIAAAGLALRVAVAGARLLAARVADEEVLRAHARSLGLPAGALVDLDRRIAPTAPRVAGRLARRGGHPDEAVVAGARVVAAVLAAEGEPVPFCVFGHTHVAADRRLDDGPRAVRYLNPGTWSSMVRAGRDPAADRLGYVEVEYGGGEPPTARLRRAGVVAAAA
jgi:UDP-2,3-diacylglucosamine pyrophosphatase LpxH